MQVGRITGTTRVLGKSQGYLGLPIRDEMITVEGGGDAPAMTSVWFPLPHELEALKRGDPVYITILGNIHPPIRVYTDREKSD